LDVATGQIKFADNLNFRALLSGAGQSASMELCDIASAGLSLKIMEAIYPLMVVAADDGEIILNQGGELVWVGARYELFALGADLRDPVTGESLGAREKKIGVIEITRSNPKTSVARAVEGAADVAEILKTKKIMCRLLN
jgi:hypothetical protein